jgi:hypothetical protein
MKVRRKIIEPVRPKAHVRVLVVKPALVVKRPGEVEANP